MGLLMWKAGCWSSASTAFMLPGTLLMDCAAGKLSGCVCVCVCVCVCGCGCVRARMRVHVHALEQRLHSLQVAWHCS